MHPKPHGPENPSDSRPSSDLYSEQREANERLVLAGLRAQEEADDAIEARVDAENRARQLRVTTEELLATAESRERLIGIIGHDLRNPLNTILVASRLLSARGNLEQGDARLVNRIFDSGQRMTRMIDQLVEFALARLGGGFQLNLVRSDLGEICHNIAEELRLSSSSEIRQTTDGDLRGTWDPDRLAEVVSNIAGNAVDHATPGTPVRIHAHDAGEMVVTDITNEGVCIPEDVLPVIFMAFRRIDESAHRKANHLGLGLYIANEIVRAHNGTLAARSSNGTTTFTMTLPREPTSSTRSETAI